MSGSDTPKVVPIRILDRQRHWQVVRTKWPILIVVFLVFLPVGVLLARLITPVYTATMIVTAARYTSDTKPGSPSGGLNSILSPQSGQLSDFQFYVKMFDSTLVAERILKDHPDLVHKIFANQWRNGHWVPPPTSSQRNQELHVRPGRRQIVVATRRTFTCKLLGGGNGHVGHPQSNRDRDIEIP